MNNIKYQSSGMFVSNNDWIHSERIIDSFEVIYVLQKEVYIYEDESYYSLKPGDVLLLEPNKTHGGFKNSPNGCSFYWLHFSADISFDFKYINLNDTLGKENILFFMSQFPNIEGVLQFNNEVLDALCFVLTEYLSVANKTLFNKSDRLVNEVIEFIRLNDLISISELAYHFGYNADYLSSLFKAKTGYGLKEYINNLKIYNIKQLLITSNFSIKEIANISGFSTPQNLISFFKYHEKTSPLKFRNCNIKMHYNNK